MRLFVGNLSFNVGNVELRAHFTSNGFEPNDVKVMSDRETGKSRGFAFVSFSSDEVANKAIAKLGGSVLDGRNIRLDAATDRQPARQTQGGYNRQPPTFAKPPTRHLPEKSAETEDSFSQSYQAYTPDPARGYKAPVDDWNLTKCDRRREVKSKRRNRNDYDDYDD